MIIFFTIFSHYLILIKTSIKIKYLIVKSFFIIILILINAYVLLIINKVFHLKHYGEFFPYLLLFLFFIQLMFQVRNTINIMPYIRMPLKKISFILTTQLLYLLSEINIIIIFSMILFLLNSHKSTIVIFLFLLIYINIHLLSFITSHAKGVFKIFILLSFIFILFTLKFYCAESFNKYVLTLENIIFFIPLFTLSATLLILLIKNKFTLFYGLD